MKPLLLSVLTPYTRAQKVSIFLQLLLIFGGATGGIGLWVGKTFVFEPLTSLPEVEKIEVLVPTPWGAKAGIALVEVSLDRLGKCGLWVNGVMYPATSTAANEFRFVVNSPNFAGWYPLPKNNRPDWLQNIVVETLTLSQED